MKYLQQISKTSNNSTLIERNCYRNVVVYDNTLPECDGYTDENKYVDYNYGTNKNKPFTIDILGDTGTLTFMLLPGLDILTIRFDKNWSIYDTFDYVNDEVNEFSMPVHKGDLCHIWVTWADEYSNSRQFSMPLNEITGFSGNGYTYTDDVISSNIYCSCEYKISGNLASLLCNDFTCDYTNVGQYTFTGLFSYGDLYDVTLTDGSTSSTPNEIEGWINYNETLIDAYDLYLPQIRLAGVYRNMFANCTKLKRGPKIITIPKSDGGLSNYCNQMFFGCDSLDYSPVVNVPLYDTQTNNSSELSGMFEDCINLKECTLITKRVMQSNTFRDSGLRRLFFDKYGPLISAQERTYLGLPSETSVITKYLQPIIWLDNFGPNVYGHSGGLSEHIGPAFYEYATPYRYVGTCWVEDDCRSYYMWQWYEALDTGNYTGDTYVLTTEKDFTGMSMRDDENNRCFPVKYKINEDDAFYSFDDRKIKSTNKFGEVNSPLLVHWSGVVPEDVAGTPMIWVDDNVAENNSELNYYKSYFSCGDNEFRLIGKLNNGYLWRFNGEYPYTKNLTDEYYMNSSQINIMYLYTSTLDLDYYLKGSHEGYGNRYHFRNNQQISPDTFWMGALVNDTVQQYNTSNDGEIIVMFNGIKPSNCWMQF